MISGYSSNGVEGEIAREYAVIIYLPSHLEKIAASLRAKFDPDYNLIPAHITIVFPLTWNRPLDELTNHISEEVAKLNEFTINLESIGDFYPNLPVIYWQVKENDQLDFLYKRIYARLEAPIPFKKLLPHVTIAREISNHRVVLVKDQIATYLPTESFEVKAVDLVSPVAGAHWVSVRTFTLLP